MLWEGWNWLMGYLPDRLPKNLSPLYNTKENIRKARRAQIQATAHWKRTVVRATREPSSRRMEAMVATQGV